MLILHRRTQESIMIGDDIEIVIVSVKGNNVQVGIGAPKGVTVLRKELWDRRNESEAPSRYQDPRYKPE